MSSSSPITQFTAIQYTLTLTNFVGSASSSYVATLNSVAYSAVILNVVYNGVSNGNTNVTVGVYNISSTIPANAVFTISVIAMN
jgi:hypothetical protein